jgi:hypothetical protein
MESIMFKLFTGNGFQMTFENGWTVSVMFGPGSYSGNYPEEFMKMGVEAFTKTYNHSECRESLNAEIAAWDKDGNWYKFEDGGKVRGFCTPDFVAAFILMVASGALEYEGVSFK